MKKTLLLLLATTTFLTSISQDLPEGFYRVCLTQDPNPNSAAGIKSLFWPNGSTINVKFVGTRNPYLENKVKQYANAWTEFANLKFNFVENGYADIKVAFRYDGSSWSRLGTSCRQSFPDEVTMNFGWFNQSTPEEEFSRTIIHEFGHALGLIHEHQNPAASIPWNRPAVYQYYAKQGWNQQMVDFNIFQKYDYNYVNATIYDRESIMHYPIDSRLTTTGYSVGWNTKLSDLDKSFIAQTYPKGIYNSASPNSLVTDNVCYFYSDASNEPLILMDPPNDEYNKIVNNIASQIGLASNKYIVKVGNVPNACAIYNKEDKKRYIIFSLNFFETLRTTSGLISYWMAKAILAHELAHHLNGDTFENSTNRQENELKADEFIGFALSKLNCPDLITAQLAINSIALDRDMTLSYPPRGARLEAVAIGWRKTGRNPDDVIKIPKKDADLAFKTSKLSGRNPYRVEVTIDADAKELLNIASVTYHLPSGKGGFTPSEITTDDPDDSFYVSLTLWGAFTVRATVKYKDGTTKELAKKFTLPD
jgi:hypothetical protein